MSVYPNPTAGNIIIEQKGGRINYDRAIVLDAQGKEINSFVLDNAKEKIALASTPSGRYMLRLMNERSGAFTLVPLVVLPF